MTDKKLLEVLDFYEQYLRDNGCWPIKRDNNTHPSVCDALDHLLAMIPQMREFVKAGRREKAFRWLGFIQGALWLSGHFTLAELKSHSRPDKEDSAIQPPKGDQP